MLEKAKKNLKIYGILFIFLGIWDIIWPIISYFLGKYNIATLATENNISEQAVKIILIVIAVIVVIFAIVKILLGIGCIKKSDGQKNANVHTGLCKVILVLNIISLLFVIPTLFNGKIDYYSFCDILTTIIVMIDLLKCNKILSK